MPPEVNISPVAAAECQVFARYLADVDASAYVLASYARLLPTADPTPATSARLIERSLLAFARKGFVPLWMADGYARFFMPRSLLRRRLMLMLAILENSPDGERLLNTGDEGSLVGVGLRLTGTMIASGLCIIVGTILFLPLQLMSGKGEPPAGAAH